MPGLDGIRTTLKVRETSSIPIIILSAKSEDADKILGLNIGADDYITKPFNPLELVARVKSQLRRYTQLGNMNNQMGNHVFKCGGLQINDENKEVTVDGELIKLTRSSTTSCFCSLKTPEKSSPSTRSTKRSGMRKPLARITQ